MDSKAKQQHLSSHKSHQQQQVNTDIISIFLFLPLCQHVTKRERRKRGSEASKTCRSPSLAAPGVLCLLLFCSAFILISSSIFAIGLGWSAKSLP
jgi:hypothetical protein